MKRIYELATTDEEAIAGAVRANDLQEVERLVHWNFFRDRPGGAPYNNIGIMETAYSDVVDLEERTTKANLKKILIHPSSTFAYKKCSNKNFDAGDLYNKLEGGGNGKKYRNLYNRYFVYRKTQQVLLAIGL
ncbi:hypothetical protein KRP22_008122 [Phytophthora ramorum]|nr:hypothetical protein KRP22_3867 [Phytophthora ramorum]